MRILIAGGTGSSGRVLARRAAAAGHHPRVLTRDAGRPTPDRLHLVQGDLTTGAGVAHQLTLSIVGVDRFPFPYYRAKLDQEAAVTAASARTGVGHSIVRVTQFHDFAALVLQRDGPTGHAPELGGPQPEDVPDMVRGDRTFDQWLTEAHRR